MFTLDSFYNILLHLTTRRKFLIAYSGGLDSHVLLHSMALIRAEYPDIQLQAIHINHGLSANADQWEKHCKKICQELAVPYTTKKIKINKKNSESLEAIARKLRYQIFAELLPQDTELLTAHTQNDQAETLLLQLFRGAGPKGLAAMPQKIPFANSEHLRPLLNFSRRELEQYAKEHQLNWVEDESNIDRKFDRNFIRHEIIPLIEKKWPAISETLSRSAKHCAEASDLLSVLAQQDLQHTQGSKEKTLSIAALLTLSASRQHNILREWLRELHFPQASDVKIWQIIHEILLAREDANPLVKWDEVEIRRYQDDLYALKPLKKIEPSWEKKWDLNQPLILPGNVHLTATPETGKGLAKVKLQGEITVRFRQNGERCQPQGRKGSHPLKKLFQEWQVPSWEREQIPLLFVNGKLAAVINYCICEEFAAKKGEEGIVMRLKKATP